MAASPSLLLSARTAEDEDETYDEDEAVKTVVRPTQKRPRVDEDDATTTRKHKKNPAASSPPSLRSTNETNNESMTSSSQRIAAVYATPLAAIFQPDEPLTATQEAWAAEGYVPPTPPPLFFHHDDDDDDEANPIGTDVHRAASSSAPHESQMSHTQREKVKAKTWAATTKAFFDAVDQRGLLVTEETH